MTVKQWIKAYSVQFAIAAAVFGALEALLPLWQPVVPHGIFAALSTLTGLLSAGLRAVKQASVSDG